MDYLESLNYIAALPPRGIRLGLERMRAFLEATGVNPETVDFQTIQVAGTNGKGSTTAYLQSLMTTLGYRTGAYFSPYVYDPRERVQLNRDLIGRAELAEIATELRPIAETFSHSSFGGISEFEFKTALGFHAFRNNSCEWVAMEVGLGGRYDATSVCRPSASIIVSIGLDHTSILGDSLGAIAQEKAAIARPGIPMMVGEVMPEVLEVIEGVCRCVEAPLWRMGKDIRVTGQGPYRVDLPGISFSDLTPGILGVRQPENMALALGAMVACGALPTGADPELVKEGVLRARAPGRMEMRSFDGLPVILDGAHNGEAAEVLGRNLLAQEMPKVSLVMAMLRGHDPRRFVQLLCKSVELEAILIVPVGVPRSLTVEELQTELGDLPQVHACHTVEEALQLAAPLGSPIVVTGSFYLLGEALIATLPAQSRLTSFGPTP